MPDPVEKPGARVVSTPSEASQGNVSALSVIDYDLLCRACGYNLRGLSPSGRCPECETPVAHALHGDWLRYSDPRWVAVIARGYRVQSAAVAIGLIAIIFAAASRESLGLPWLTMAIALTVGTGGLVGVWMTTAREPATADAERVFSVRRLLRMLTIGGIGLQAGSGYVSAIWPAAALPVRLLAAVVMLLGILCAFRHAVNLSQRIPDEALVAETNTVMWGLIISYGVFLGIIALALSSAGSFTTMIACGLSCTVIVACVIFTLWCLTLFSRYAKSMRLAAIDARHMASRKRSE